MKKLTLFLLSACLFGIIAVSGCGGNASSVGISQTTSNGKLSEQLQVTNNSDQVSSATKQDSEPVDPCSVITKDEAEAEIGSVNTPRYLGSFYVESVPPKSKSCEIDSVEQIDVNNEGMQPRYVIFITSWDYPRFYPDRADAQTVSDLGDDAFWSEEGLDIRKGSREIAINLSIQNNDTIISASPHSGSTGDPDLKQKVLNFAKKVVDRL
ncbi:MAG: hypothetical protein M1309_01990 [Actinobacteria bacterium]|nr:hypothetical protein [Actinomycetota bacterium]